MTGVEVRRDQVPAPVVAEPVEAPAPPVTGITEQQMLAMLSDFAEPLRRIPAADRAAWHRAMTNWALRCVANSVDNAPHFHLAQRWLMTAELVWTLP